ncbi:MAG: gamma-glutamylcyclotransferase [Burkholderiales bacterium]
MKVDRLFLEEDGVRRAVREAGYGHLLLSDEALAQSLASILAQRPERAPVWVFGYGSLIWSPMMRFEEKRVARLRGYHRGFYLWSRINRGTPQRPGLVLGLDRGGSCGGMAYRLHESRFEDELALLWRREMPIGTYTPRWVRLETGRARCAPFRRRPQEARLCRTFERPQDHRHRAPGMRSFR